MLGGMSDGGLFVTSQPYRGSFKETGGVPFSIAWALGYFHSIYIAPTAAL